MSFSPLAFLLLVPFFAQAGLMVVDEFYFHRRRGLGAWERMGHPLDSMTVLNCFLWLIFAPLTRDALMVYLILSAFSCVFVTKDEFVHAQSCKPMEQWLHAILFVLHPVVFGAAGVIRWLPEFSVFAPILLGQSFAIAGFMAYQLIYWNLVYEKTPSVDFNQ